MGNRSKQEVRKKELFTNLRRFISNTGVLSRLKKNGKKIKGKEVEYAESNHLFTFIDLSLHL